MKDTHVSTLGSCDKSTSPHAFQYDCIGWHSASISRPEDTREDIASTDDDIKRLNERIAEIALEIPRLERERLTCERDVAEAKLKRIALQSKLDAMEGK